MEAQKLHIQFITGNPHKFEEVQQRLIEEKLEVELSWLNIDTLEIQAESIEEVAVFKLKNIQKRTTSSYFVEDSGFFVDIPLNGFPGVYSSYVHKTLGNEGMLKLIGDHKQSKAHFETVIAFYYEPEVQIYTFHGRVDGKVSSQIRGSYGFGYDPIFIPEQRPEKTFAELTTREKNELSHRGKALDQFIAFLRNL